MQLFVSKGYLFEQFVVPCLSEASHKRLTKILVQRFTVGMVGGTATDVPLMIVDGDELAIVVESEGVEMTRDGFHEIGLAVTPGLLDGTVGGTVGAPSDKGTLTIVDQRGRDAKAVFADSDTLLFNCCKPFFSHVGFDLGKDAFEIGHFLLFEGGTSVTFDTALSLAFGQRAAEATVDDVFGDDTIGDDEHGYCCK